MEILSHKVARLQTWRKKTVSQILRKITTVSFDLSLFFCDYVSVILLAFDFQEEADAVTEGVLYKESYLLLIFIIKK